MNTTFITVIVILCLHLLAVESVSGAGETTDRVRHIQCSHVTSKAIDAETDDDFSLRISRPSGPEIVIPFPNLKHNERERGKRDNYSFDVESHQLTAAEVVKCRFYLRTHGKNGWLPKSIKVEAMTAGNERIVLVDRAWPEQWFSVTKETATDGFPLIASAEWDLLSEPVPQVEYAKRYAKLHVTTLYQEDPHRTSTSVSFSTDSYIHVYNLSNTHKLRKLGVEIQIWENNKLTQVREIVLTPGRKIELYRHKVPVNTHPDQLKAKVVRVSVTRAWWESN